MEFVDVVWGTESIESLIAESVSAEGQALLPSPDQLAVNLDQIEKWLRESFQALGSVQAHMVAFQLGDAPELLAGEAYMLAKGQESADEILDSISEDNWEWLDDDEIINFDDVVDIGYNKVNELPYPPYDFDNEEDEEESNSLDYDDRESLWGLMVLKALGRLVEDRTLGSHLRHGQTAVPILVGYEDAPELVAILTPKGLQKPFA